MKTSLLFLCIALGSASAISPPNFVNSSTYDDTVESTQGIGAPDPRFSVLIDFDGPKIPLISYLANTVQILCQLGLEDFSGTTQATSWKLVDHPDVGIVTLPKIAGRPIERRFIIWGLFQSAVDMIRMRRFQTASIVLKWDRAEVGMILIVQWQEMQNLIPVLCHSANSGLEQQSTPPVNISANISICAAPTMTNDLNQDLRVLGYLTGSTVDVLSVFLVTMTVITEAAQKAATERIDEYISPANIPGVLISFLSSIPPRTSPPFFEAQWLIRSVAAIPNYMIEKGVFRESLFLVEVNGIRVADAFLEERSLTIGSSPAITNISGA